MSNKRAIMINNVGATFYLTIFFTFCHKLLYFIHMYIIHTYLHIIFCNMILHLTGTVSSETLNVFFHTDWSLILSTSSTNSFKRGPLQLLETQTEDSSFVPYSVRAGRYGPRFLLLADTMGRRLSDSSSSPGTSGVWLEQGAEQRMCHRRHCITEPHSFTPDSIHIHAPGLHLLPDVASVACTPQSEIKACSLKGWNAFCRWLFCCDIWGVRKRKVFFTWQTQSFKGVFLHWVMNRSVNCKDLAF